jgi:hypothetical protein
MSHLMKVNVLMTALTTPQAPLTLATQIQRTPTILYSDLSDEVAMMDIDQGQYFGVDHAAARLWLLLDAPMSIDAICHQLVSEYDIALDACRAEVLAFVADLQGHGLITLVH